ncbi:MAG: HAMP domain-containing histidine kinase [Arcobacteraceae bacterium]|nr:HAMP domain-containing histidine kinase [Arcobacteraceae bacterium]
MHFNILLIVCCALLYFALTKTLIDDIFKIDDKLKEKIEKTMHEINTPVATIQINTEILQTKINDVQNLERLDRINKACDNLLKLYEDMEYYIKKEIDNVEIVSFELEELLLYCIEKFDDIKDDIKIDIDVKPTIITTDKNGFEAMITNLTSNAIKHNSSISSINIQLQNNILTFKDDGGGISTENIYKVFNKYFQSDDKSKGFGIGLNMVKEFCNEQKLDIKINSSSKGTIFNINLKNIIVVN